MDYGVMSGERERVMALTRDVARGSSWQVEGLDFLIRSVLSETDGRTKAERDWEGE